MFGKKRIVAVEGTLASLVEMILDISQKVEKLLTDIKIAHKANEMSGVILRKRLENIELSIEEIAHDGEVEIYSTTTRDHEIN
jgi:hypothetical protein